MFASKYDKTKVDALDRLGVVVFYGISENDSNDEQTLRAMVNLPEQVLVFVLVPFPRGQNAFFFGKFLLELVEAELVEPSLILPKQAVRKERQGRCTRKRMVCRMRCIVQPNLSNQPLQT